MNKVYKVIWSKVRNCYVVVSELAKRNGKCSSSLNKKIIAAFLAAGMTLTYSVVAEAVASELTTDNRNVGRLVNADGAREITSPYIQVQGVEEATAAREFIQNNPDRNLYAGTNRTKQAEWDRQYNLANSYASATGNYAIAVGRYATTGRKATEAEAQIGAYNALQQTIKNDAAFAGVTAVQNATNYAALVSALNSVGGATANSYVTQLNNRVTSLQNATPPTSTNAIAVGNNATAGGTSAIAVGNAATALKEDGTAANNAIAVGNGAKARNTNAIAVGAGETISRDVKRPGTTTTIKTSTQTGAYGKYDIAIGKAAAHGERANATTGDDSTTDIGGYYTINTSTALPSAKNENNPNGGAIAVGYEAQAVRQNTIAVGTLSMAGGQDAIAVGRNARALTPGSIAIGSGEAGQQGIQGNGGINTPKDTPDKGGYSIAIGAGATNFTFGFKQDDDYYANARNSIAIGHYAHTHAANAFAIGVGTDATAERSFSIGTTSTSANSNETHHGARAGGQGSLTFGDQAVVGVHKPSTNTNEEERGGHVLVNDAMAMGTNSWARARNAVALGGGMSYTYHDTSADGKTMINVTKYYDGSQNQWVDIAEGTGAHVGLEADGGVAIGGATGSVDLNGSESHWPTTAPGAVTGYTAAATVGDKATRAVAIGSGSVIGDNAVNSVAVGARNIVTGVNSTAVGAGESDAAADGKKYANMVTAVASAAFGNTNKIGKQEFKDVEKEVVIKGSKTKVWEPNVLQPDATTTGVFVVGGENEIANASGSATSIGVFGSTNKVEGSDSTNSTMIGNSNTVTNKLTNSLVAGNSNTGLDTVDNSQIIGNNNTAIGVGVSNLVVLGNKTTAKAEIKQSIAIGEATTVNASNAIAMGTAASVSVENGVALGSSSVAARDKANGGAGAGYDIVTGTNYAGTGADTATWVSTLAAISVGGDSSNAAIGQDAPTTRQLTGLAAGTADTDAVNVAQLKRVGEAATITTDNRNVSLITNAAGRQEITSPYIHVEGVEAATKNYNDALAAYLASNEYYYLSDADKPAALEAKIAELRNTYGFASATGTDSIAFGHGAAASKVDSIAFGPASTASGEASLAVGYNAQATKYNSVALGSGATASLSDSVALGSGATTAAGTKVQNATVGGIRFGEFAGQLSDLNRVVSVGAAGAERQIQNVAAGRVSATSTDAINGSQLYAAYDQLQWKIGTGASGGVVNDSLPLSTVGKNGTYDRSNIYFKAGPGIKISGHEETDGYSITLTNMVEHIEPTVPNGDYIHYITYNGKNYYIGGGTGSVELTSDKRAVVTSMMTKTDPITKETTDYLEIFSPYIHINGVDVNATDRANAAKPGSMAIGQRAEAEGDNSTAIGHNADAKSFNSTAIGFNSHAHGSNSVSIGTAATSSGNRAIAIGTSASKDMTVPNSKYDPTEAHQGARAAGQGAIVLGDRARAMSSTHWVDDDHIGEPDMSVNDAIAIGTKAEVRARNAIALGGNLSYTNEIKDENGNVIQALTYYGTAGNVAGGRSFGAVVGDSADSGIAIGGAYGKLTKSADGTYVISQEIEGAATMNIRGIAIGSGALVADPAEFENMENLISSEAYQNAKTEFLAARADYMNKLAAYNAIKDLTPNDPSLPPGMQVTQEEIDRARNLKDQASARLATASDAYSQKIKEKIGYETSDNLEGEDAIAIGTLATASVRDSIALGSKSVTNKNDKAGSLTGLSGYDIQTGGEMRGIDDTDANAHVWRSTAGSLSLGGTQADGTVITRRISNVAAGYEDTDAVNVAQLKRASIYSSDNRNTALGYDENGNLSINSPYLNINGVAVASDTNSIAKRYSTLDEYTAALNDELSVLQTRKDTVVRDLSTISTDLAALEQERSSGQITDNEYRQRKEELEERQHVLEIRLNGTDSDPSTGFNYLIDAKNAEISNAATTFSEAKRTYNDQSNAYGNQSMAVGYRAKSGGSQSVSIGVNNQVGTVTDLDKISTDTDAQKEAKQKEAARSIAIGADNKITGTANTESSTDSIALGTGNTITNASKALAMGSGNTVTGEQSIAIGTELKVYGKNSGAIGDPMVIAADSSYAVGNGNNIGNTAYADGDPITENNIFVMGNENTVSKGEHIYVLGSNVQINTTDASNSVFLGNETKYVEAGASTAGIGSYGHAVNSPVKINGKDYAFAGSTPYGVVSVGDAGKERRIQNVAAGLISADSTDAINGSQLYQAMQALSVQVIGDTDTETRSTKVNTNPEPATTGGTATGGDTPGGTAGGTTTGDTPGGTTGGTAGGTDTNIVREITLTPTVTYEVKASTTEVVLGDDSSGNTKTKGNLLLRDLKSEEVDTVNDPKSYKYQLDLNKDIDLGKDGSVKTGDTVMNNNGLTVGDTTVARDRVTVGDTTVNNDGVSIAGGPSMTKEGIAAGGKKITNVAPGEADTDAVNVGQLRDYAAANNEALTNLGNQIGGVEHRMKKGLAGAAALAALHPLDFDPDDKLTFAAGMGHYRGENAAALGMFYRPDEKVMFSVGGTMGNGENMINAGVSFSLDRTARVTGSRTALTKEVVQLREHVAKQDAQIAELTALVKQLAGNAGLNLPAGSALPGAPALFPDNLDNKWAYDTLEELEQKGYITGYAGRSLSRQQFAAALDRAMAGGAKLDERIVKEFEPELSHVRVAHVEGHGNNEGEWYERPRASHDKLEDKHEIDKKHFRVKEKKVTSKS